MSSEEQWHGYCIGDVVKNMKSKSTGTITGYVDDHKRRGPGFSVKNNRTNKTKVVLVRNLDAFWSKHRPSSVRIWTPEAGWTEGGE
jgi:hypothetical protein